MSLNIVTKVLIFTLTTSVGQTTGRCITQLAKMCIDPKLIELIADVFRRISTKCCQYREYGNIDDRNTASTGSRSIFLFCHGRG